MADPFVPQVGYSALKPIIKHQTLSLKVSNAGGLEQATACISLLTLYSTITKQHRCLVWMAAAQWHETIHVLNTLNWYCAERTCFWISACGSANSNASKTAKAGTLPRTRRSCFVIFRFVARGHSVQSRSFRFAVSAWILSAVYTYQVPTKSYRFSLGLTQCHAK